MSDNSVPEALMAALETDHEDLVSVAALADWYEEHDQPRESACLRWLAQNGRSVGYYERQTQYGKYYWHVEGPDPVLPNEHHMLPKPLWEALKGNDEPHKVGAFKSYKTARKGYEALLAGWLALPEGKETEVPTSESPKAEGTKAEGTKVAGK